MIISDSIHTILDTVSTDLKRRFSRHPHRHQSFWEHNGDWQARSKRSRSYPRRSRRRY